MNNQELEEACQVIAEFMGDQWSIEDGEYHRNGAPICDYNNSLDNLVPIWEKLVELNFSDFEFNTHCEGWSFSMMSHEQPFQELGADGKTIQQVACLATAKAIQSIREEKR